MRLHKALKRGYEKATYLSRIFRFGHLLEFCLKIAVRENWGLTADRSKSFRENYSVPPVIKSCQSFSMVSSLTGIRFARINVTHS